MAETKMETLRQQVADMPLPSDDEMDWGDSDDDEMDLIDDEDHLDDMDFE